MLVFINIPPKYRSAHNRRSVIIEWTKELTSNKYGFDAFLVSSSQCWGSKPGFCMCYRACHHWATSPAHSVSFNALNFNIHNDNEFFNPSCKSTDVIFGLQTARWLKIEVKKKSEFSITSLKKLLSSFSCDFWLSHNVYSLYYALYNTLHSKQSIRIIPTVEVDFSTAAASLMYPTCYPAKFYSKHLYYLKPSLL